jgi:hypothetical protein
MWKQIRSAAIVALISGGTATVAFAQGSITQDPGRMTPGNLTTDRLGPSTGLTAGTNGRSGAGDMPNGHWAGSSPSIGRNSVTTSSSGDATTIFHGTSGSYGSSNPTGPGLSARPPSKGGNP